MDIALAATRRDVFGKETKTLRRRGVIPAVLYGHGLPTQHLSIDAHAFERLYAQVGETSLFDVSIDGGAPVKVLVQDVHRDPVKDRVLHADLHQVSMTEAIEAEIPLVFIGESPAVKEHGGVLVKSLDQVKVRCLPGDLVPSIEVDIATLKTFDDAIHVRDLVLGRGLKVLGRADEVVATVAPPRSEEELKSLEEKVEADAAAVEVVGKKAEAADEATADESSATPDAAKKD